MLNVLTEKQIEETISKPAGSAAEFNRMKSWLEERIAKGKKAPHSEIVTLTPVLASLLMDRNPLNRPISKQGRNELRQDIANGQYVFNGESIVVSNSGILNDGQHRCQTVIDTGRSIQTVIVFGPDEESRYTIDTGRSKSVSNLLAMEGRKYTHVLGPAAKYVLEWKQKGALSYTGDSKPTKQAIRDAVSKLKGLEASVELTALGMKTVRNHAVLAFCHYVFCKASTRENADHFMTKLIEGDGLRRGDPILYCRNKLIGMGRGHPAGERAELVFKCWNAFRNDSTIELFRSTGRLPKVER